MFSTLPKTKIIILSNSNLSSANAFNLELSKNLSFGKELNATQEGKTLINSILRVRVSRNSEGIFNILYNTWALPSKEQIRAKD